MADEGALRSSVIFRSNLMVRSDDFWITDKRFLASIREPKALNILHEKAYPLTPVQDEARRMAVPCICAQEGDFPWGTVWTEHGLERVVCKCRKRSCRYFKNCRPDFRAEATDEKPLADKEQLRRAREEVKKSAAVSAAEMVSILPEILTMPPKEEEIEALAPVEESESAVDLSAFMAKPKRKRREAREVPKTVPETTSSVGTPTFRSVTQEEIIVLSPQERAVVNAGPGTGKTWTLIEKIRRFLEEGELRPDEMLVLCFSRAAVSEVKNRLAEEATPGWMDVEVRSFDSFGTALIIWAQEERPDLLAEDYDLCREGYEERIITATSILEKFPQVMAHYRHLIVDEVQDLVGERAKLVLALLKALGEEAGFTLLGDSCQALYDYQGTDKADFLSSEKFYKRLFQDFGEASFFSLEENHRQSYELQALISPYRKAVLSGDVQEARGCLQKIGIGMAYLDGNLVHFDQQAAAKYVKEGTLGILTRTNGQAFRISTYLNVAGVPHRLARALTERELDGWLVNLFEALPGETMSEAECAELYEALYEEGEGEDYWRAIVQTQGDTNKRHYEAEALLRGLMVRAQSPLLYESPSEDLPLITVSTIHRAKGHEFKTVILMEDLFEEAGDGETLLEHKVRYVALTRPQSKLLKAKGQDQPIWISKDSERRCFTRRKRKNYISAFEVGRSGDLDVSSFAASPELQEYLKGMEASAALRLLKCPEGESAYVMYRLVPEADEEMTLAYTTEHFAYALKRAIGRIFGNNYVDYQWFPDILAEIYTEGPISCIAPYDQTLKGAKRFGSMCIWRGLRIGGLARVEQIQY